MTYGMSRTLDLPFEAAVKAVRDALQDQGFGVLTEIDVTATLKTKLDEDMEDYVILGACNPPLAHRALGVDRSIGLLLPCNVVVRTVADGSRVEIADPEMLVGVTGDGALEPVAAEAGRRLDAVLAALG
jgi:uncharacterized protein (DUF302 family)